MANLFNYATKELSQDAFLRWLFESFNDTECLKPIVIDFIHTFTQGQKEENRKPLDLSIADIDRIVTFSQVDHIDVAIDIFLKPNNNHITLVIEDKTDTEEHKQLDTYNNKIETWKGYDKPVKESVYKIFYKTNIIFEDEQRRVNAANWTYFDINDINNFFKKYKNKTNERILNDYIDHIEELEKRINAPTFSDGEECKYDFIIIKIRDCNINNIDEVYKQVRGIWVIDKNKANKIPYVLAVNNGLVVGVFKIKENGWKKCEDSKRNYFDGEVAPKEVWDYFIGKRIPEKYVSTQNPISYRKQ